MKKLMNSVDTVLTESLDGFGPPMPISSCLVTTQIRPPQGADGRARWR
jgi:hypothetical protein